MGDRYGARTLVWVVPYTGSTVKYGFQTNADAATQTALGHTAVPADYPAGLVIGANAPKPPRATRKRTTGTDSSYCSAGAVTTARAAGWRVSPGKVRNGSSSARSKAVYVTVDGNKIAWKMPLTTYNAIGADRTALGILDATATMLDLVFGVRYPKLPRVGIFQAGGSDGGNQISTFCDPQSLDDLPAGWTPVRASQDVF